MGGGPGERRQIDCNWVKLMTILQRGSGGRAVDGKSVLFGKSFLFHQFQRLTNSEMSIDDRYGARIACLYGKRFLV
jgi:hypothetical protein